MDRSSDDAGPAARTYRVLSGGATIETDSPAAFAGITTTGVFGRLTCPSGRRARPEHRVFLATWEEALAAGFRPCRRCRPQPDDRYERTDAGRRLIV